MNPVAIATQFSVMPEGVPVENRRQRVTVVLAMAAAIATPMPSSPIANGDLRAYFNENGCTDKFFDINEAIPYDVDRAQEYAFRLYERRYNLAFNTKASDLLKLTPFSQTLLELMPEYEGLQIQNGEVADAVQLLCASQAV